jgi:hypothetical protein
MAAWAFALSAGGGPPGGGETEYVVILPVQAVVQGLGLVDPPADLRLLLLERGDELLLFGECIRQLRRQPFRLLLRGRGPVRQIRVGLGDVPHEFKSVGELGERRGSKEHLEL